MHKNQRLRIILSLVAIIAIFFGLLSLHFLKIERSLPSEGWSRAVDIPFEIDSKQEPYVLKNDGTFQLFSVNEGKVKQLTLNSELEKVKQSELPYHASEEYPLWTNGTDFLFINSNKKLVHAVGNEENILADGINGMTLKDDLVLYWKENKIFKVNLDQLSTVPVKEIDSPVKDIAIQNNSADSFLVISKPTNDFTVGMLYKEEKNTYTEKLQFKLKHIKAYEIFQRFQYAINDGKLMLAYEKAESKGNTFTPMYTEGTVDSFDGEVAPRSMKIYPQGSGLSFENAKHINFKVEEGTPKILFTAWNQISSFSEEFNIFQAKQNEEGKWIASRLSKTPKRSSEPFWLDDSNVVWFEANSGTTFETIDYKLMGTSTNPEVIETSTKMTMKDIKNALSTGLLGASMGLITLLIGFAWVTPAALFLLAMFMFNPTAIEQGKRWALYTAYGLFFITQLIFLQKQFNPAFYAFAPGYLTFAGSSFVIPIIVALLAYLIGKVVLRKEDRLMVLFSYTVAVDLLILALLVGPYRF
ncbi:MFS transporter [Pseudalkalibacillus caeni]|uniref:MFS transporter n=1 Tax=Exobacillus caeni TaxID=2574798 RepID=A0A5R9F112_9BACL|nr:MFS transporter [Pseudalkalibacillus caeni]TLS36116.1 MFS transporter [Pseudalkalibacillus caeni]